MLALERLVNRNSPVPGSFPGWMCPAPPVVGRLQLRQRSAPVPVMIFKIWTMVAGKTPTTEPVELLLRKGKTSEIKGFTSKAGKKFDAMVFLQDKKTGKLAFEFKERKMKKPKRNPGQVIDIDDLIDSMPEDVLMVVHDRVVNRLNELQQKRTMQSMADFRPGDVVRFRTERGELVTGVLIRLNKKSVTVHTANGNRWKVAPQFLTKVERAETLDALDSMLDKVDRNTFH